MQQLPKYIKPSIFLGSVMGIILGFLLTIPIIQLFVIFVFFAIGAIEIVMLVRNHFADNLEQKDGIIIGGIAGFSSVIAASTSFLLFAIIFGTIFRGSYDLILAFFTSFSAIVVLLILIFCIAFMNMIFNIGSALLVLSLFMNTKEKEDKK